MGEVLTHRISQDDPFFKIADGDRGFGRALPPARGTGKKGGSSSS